MKTDLLIEELSKNSMVKVRSPWASSAQGFSFSLIFFALLVGFYELRPDLSEKITEPLYLIKLGLLLCSGVLSVAASTWVSIPNMPAKRWFFWVVFLPLALWGAILLSQITQLYFATPEAVHPEPMDLFCIQNFMLFLFIPGAFQFFQISKFAPTLSGLSGGFAVLFSTSMGNFFLLLLEQNDRVFHQVFWHLVPTVVFILIGAQVGKKILKW